MKPVFLFIGLSIILIGAFVVVFFYPTFLRVSEQKRVADLRGASYQLTEYYQQIVTECKETLILLLSGTMMLIRGVSVTLYGVTSKKEMSKELIKSARTEQKPEQKGLSAPWERTLKFVNAL